jgi:hypothetical protein
MDGTCQDKTERGRWVKHDGMEGVRPRVVARRLLERSWQTGAAKNSENRLSHLHKSKTNGVLVVSEEPFRPINWIDAPVVVVVSEAWKRSTEKNDPVFFGGAPEKRLSSLHIRCGV